MTLTELRYNVFQTVRSGAWMTPQKRTHGLGAAKKFNVLGPRPGEGRLR